MIAFLPPDFLGSLQQAMNCDDSAPRTAALPSLPSRDPSRSRIYPYVCFPNYRVLLFLVPSFFYVPHVFPPSSTTLDPRSYICTHPLSYSPRFTAPHNHVWPCRLGKPWPRPVISVKLISVPSFWQIHTAREYLDVWLSSAPAFPRQSMRDGNIQRRSLDFRQFFGIRKSPDACYTVLCRTFYQEPEPKSLNCSDFSLQSHLNRPSFPPSLRSGQPIVPVKFFPGPVFRSSPPLPKI